MFKIYKKEIEIAGKKISLETGKIARQADGAIIATCGETVVLATAVGAKKINPDGTRQGYYYGNGFYGHDEGDKGEANKKKKANPLWMSLLMILCINY